MKRIEKFENQQIICKEIDSIVSTKQINYIDAAIEYAKNKDLEIEYVAELISRNNKIRSLIEEEAEELNFLKRKARLPI